MSTPDSAQARVHDWVQSNRDSILQTLRDIVAIETHNRVFDGGEKPAQLLIAEKLRALNCETEVYELASVPGLLEHPAYVASRPCTNRPNVLGVRKGSGEGTSLLLSSHVDTIGVGPVAWKHDPFAGEIEDGKFFGLGAYDMKAGIAASLAVVQCLNDLQISLRGDLLIESVVDEEQGGGNGTLAARLKVNADFAILPEPTDDVLAVSHNAALLLRATLRGQSGIMIGAGRPKNAAIDIAHLIAWLDEWQATRVEKWSASETQKETPLPFLISQLNAGETHLPLGERLPDKAWMVMLIAAYPDMTQEQVFGSLMEDFRAAQAQPGVLQSLEPEWEIVRWLDGTATPADHPGVQTFFAAQEKVTGSTPVIGGMPAPCDGAIFNRHSSTPVLILGPHGGNAHAPDEFIMIDKYLDFIETFIIGTLDWCGVAPSS
jgi:acetylornithine deacetylase